MDYSAVISKYLGDTAKPIKAAFQAAREQDAIQFFDEADSLLSKRVATGESCSTSIHQNRNTLMQELDRFDGVVIVTTNLFENYDPALLRHLQRHIKFRLPNASMRRELFALHLPTPERVKADDAPLAALSRGLSGGDILNVCVNAIRAGSTDVDSTRWRVTQAMLERKIAKVKKSKAEHSGAKPGRERRIGLLQGWWVPTCCQYGHARQTCEVGLFVATSSHEFLQLCSVPTRRSARSPSACSCRVGQAT